MENLHCLKCHKVERNLLKHLEDEFDSKKVFIGYLTDSGIIAVQVSKEITYQDGLVIAETVLRMTECQ